MKRPWTDEFPPPHDPAAAPRVLTRSDARALGFTPDEIKHRLATGRWQRILPRTYLTSDTLTWADRLVAATKFAGPGSLLSGAAALADLDLRSVTRPRRLLVLVADRSGPRSTGWVRVRPSDRPMTRASLPGPPRAHPARAVADLALELRREDDVRMLVAQAVRSRLCTIDELTVELEEGPRRGSAHLRQAIDEIAGGAWSAPEARAARLMRAAGLPRFEQNARIDLPGGAYVVVDFLWRALRAILEIDSDTHHALAGDADRTGNRHLALETLGFSVVHRTPRVVRRDPGGFTDGIAAWLAARAAQTLG